MYIINDNKMPSIAPTITSLVVCLSIFTLAQPISGIRSNRRRKYPPYTMLKAVIRAEKEATCILTLILMFIKAAITIPSMIPNVVIERIGGPFRRYKFIRYINDNSPPIK